MATGATYTFIYVNAVIEVDEVRQIVDPRPLNGLSAAEAVAHGLQHGGVGPDQCMTFHASLRRRNAGKAGLFDRRVAVTAIEPQPGDMVLVAERDGLLRGYVLAGDVRRALQLEQRRSHRRKKKNRAKNAGPCQRIGTAVKDLCHEF